MIPHGISTRAIAVSASLVLASAALAGCSSKDKSSDQPTTAPVAPSVAATLPAIPAFKGKVAGAVADVKIVQCPTDKGEQTVKLALTNSTKTARDYAIMVIWLKNDSGTPLGATLLKQKAAAPGKKVDLTAKGKVLDKADRCVLNVQAGTLK